MLLGGFSALDLTGPEGRFAARLLEGLGMGVVHDEALAGEVDVVLESGPPSGLRHKQLRAAYPHLVTVAITPFGESGPRADWRATDATLLAAGGLTSISGDPDRPPVQAPGGQAWKYASLWAALGTVLALHRGVGEHVEVSVQEAIASQEHLIREAAYDGILVRREGSQHKHVAPGRVFPCRDGHVYLFVNSLHWQAFLDAWTGHPPALDGEDWASAPVRRERAAELNAMVASWTGGFGKVELTELLQSRGVPCLPVNSPAEVRTDPHLAARGFVVDGRFRPPLLVETTRPAAPNRRRGGKLLEGVRVLSLTTGIAGPTAARLLANFGADVVKLESRAGGLDAFRFFGPDLESSSRFLECNLGVRSLALNLKTEKGRALVRELVAVSDVVLDNFRPNVLPRLGLGDDELRAVNPSVVVAHMPGLGSTGPRALYGTWGPTLAAYSGLTWLWNHPGQAEPVGSQGVYPDYLASVYAPLAIVAALLRGGGAVLDLAQVELAAYALEDAPPEPIGNALPGAELHGCYPARGDDRWLVVACLEKDDWRRLCAATGIDPATADRGGAVAAWAATRDTHESAETLQAAGIAASPVQDAADLVADPHLGTRGFVQTVHHPKLGEVRLAGLPIRFTEAPRPDLGSAPLLGEHDDEIVCGLLGHTQAELAGWRDQRVVY